MFSCRLWLYLNRSLFLYIYGSLVEERHMCLWICSHRSTKCLTENPCLFVFPCSLVSSCSTECSSPSFSRSRRRSSVGAFPLVLSSPWDAFRGSRHPHEPSLCPIGLFLTPLSPCVVFLFLPVPTNPIINRPVENQGCITLLTAYACQGSSPGVLPFQTHLPACFCI